MRRKVLLAAGACSLALVVPAAIVLGGGNPPTAVNFVNGTQTAWSTSETVSTGSRTFKPVVGMPQGDEVLFDTISPSPVQISIDLRRGKAKLRIVERDGDAITPTSVLVTGRGVHTATFFIQSSDLEEPVIQWKKVGRPRVRAASIVATNIGPQD
jgi:hypothetical protein